jgi:long-chain acyl-CoA synthetase
VLRTPSLMLGYYDRPQATAEALRDGWLYTGASGVMDEDGYFTIIEGAGLSSAAVSPAR